MNSPLVVVDRNSLVLAMKNITVRCYSVVGMYKSSPTVFLGRLWMEDGGKAL